MLEAAFFLGTTTPLLTPTVLPNNLTPLKQGLQNMGYTVGIVVH
tara:strand:- start:59 stop:190 length:132 start_codon:yes stop_codon:yes gene_type:complete